MTATNMCSNFGGFRCRPPLSIIFLLLDYLALDKQLDSLNSALDTLEKRSDNLQEETQRFLRDAKAARGEVIPGETNGMEEMDRKKEEKKDGQNYKKD